MRNPILLVLFVTVSTNLEAQTYKQQNFEHSIHGLTTIINVVKSGPRGNYYASFGSGFFYHKYKEPQPEYPSYRTNSIDSSLQSIWLITNKHVLFGKESYQKKKPDFPLAIDFYMRKIVKGLDRPLWDTIRIPVTDLVILTKTHTDSLTDIVAINVTKYILPRLAKGDSLYYYGAISKANFPVTNLNNGFDLSIGNEILAIGYPQNFYDTYNLFPTIKSGVIASKWKTKYNGSPFFLIDCKLFPGSSGSIIISKHIKYGGANSNEEFDFFQFLGVYSGEFFRQKETIEFGEMTIIKKESYDTGNEWYYYLIEEIINK